MFIIYDNCQSRSELQQTIFNISGGTKQFEVLQPLRLLLVQYMAYAHKNNSDNSTSWISAREKSQ